ncbi:MAG: hypothetical protein E7360_02745 [Clostridiales bacterium]|nr:hypothetical protein [Clostridiales bacterium]
MKKFAIIIVVFSLCLSFSSIPIKAQAKSNNESESANLDEEINSLIDDLDLSKFESYLNSIPEVLSGNESAKSQLKKLLKGEFSVDFSTISSYVTSLLFSGIKDKLPTFISIFVLLIVCVIVNSIKSEKLGSSVYEITRFACFAVIICIVCTVAYSLISDAKSAIERTGKVVQSVFPIMLALMAVTGSSASVAVYNPAVLFVSDFVVIIINKVVFPVVLGMLAISVISNVCKTVKLNGLLNFSSSTLKWIIGLIATVFSLFMTVRGLNSGAFDGISMRALKYTVNSSVPIVGGILRDGLDLILASGILVKNALGALAIVIIFGVVIKPVIEIACVSLALKLINAVLEPLNDARTGNFINSVCSVINFAIASLIIVSFMYVIIIIMAICTTGGIY